MPALQGIEAICFLDFVTHQHVASWGSAGLLKLGRACFSFG
jgi:hypothetical protein